MCLSFGPLLHCIVMMLASLCEHMCGTCVVPTEAMAGATPAGGPAVLRSPCESVLAWYGHAWAIDEAAEYKFLDHIPRHVRLQHFRFDKACESKNYAAPSRCSQALDFGARALRITVQQVDQSPKISKERSDQSHIQTGNHKQCHAACCLQRLVFPPSWPTNWTPVSVMRI